MIILQGKAQERAQPICTKNEVPDGYGRYARYPGERIGKRDRPLDEEKMTWRDWVRVFVYFILGLFLLFVFFYMIFAGPKAALIAGVTLLVGIILWVVFRYILKEIA